MKTSLLTAALALSAITALADPQVSSWFTMDSTNVARVYLNDQMKASGQTVATWHNWQMSQSQPAYCGVQEILSSANWLYVRSTGLGSHVMGPWYGNTEHTRPFPNLPTDQHFIMAFPRHPAAQTGQRFNPLGEIGLFVDGVRMFDANDAFSYSTANGRDASPMARLGQGDHIWNRDAWVNESQTFDPAFGHQQNRGTYHYHAQPIALRYLLGDHVDFDATTKTYSESTATPAKHSPIIGWMRDGYPLYGPYGYSDPKNPNSGVRRMISGFVLRDGSNGSDNLNETGRRSLPAWAARMFGRPATLSQNQIGPDINATYPLGHYIEDYAYLGDLGKTLGKDFDLDECNGRWCVTPEFPNGTYAYFTTIKKDGTPAYPYNMGRRYHGNPSGRIINAVAETVVTNFVNPVGLASAKPVGATNNTVSLVWRPDSGHYDAQVR
jgi:YHYH protein